MEKWGAGKQTFQNMFELASLTVVSPEVLPVFQERGVPSPRSFFRTTASVPDRFPGSGSPQALWVGLWASGPLGPHSRVIGPAPTCAAVVLTPAGRDVAFFFFNEKFFKFYSALQFFKSFAHVISYNPITTPPLFPYPYLAPPRIPLPSGNHWFVLCIF